jgi:3-oxosteroid 1-dehydrogenase
MVNAGGVRFTNEAAPYSDVVHAMYRLNATAPDIPAWLIVDQNYRDRYLFQEVLPALPFPDSWYSSGAVFKSATLAGLARQIGVPPAALVSTVSRFNGFAATGVDRDFGRGSSAYDHYYTDPAVTPTPAWPRSGCRRSMRSRSSLVISAPRAAWSPTPARGCST